MLVHMEVASAVNDLQPDGSCDFLKSSIKSKVHLSSGAFHEATLCPRRPTIFFLFLLALGFSLTEFLRFP